MQRLRDDPNTLGYKGGHKGGAMLPVYSPGETWVWRAGARQFCGLGGDLLVEAQVLLDFGDALQRVVDFLVEAGDVLDFFLEVIEVEADRFEFGVDRG